VAWVFAALVILFPIINCASKNHDTIAGWPGQLLRFLLLLVSSCWPEAIAYTGLLGIVAACSIVADHKGGQSTELEAGCYSCHQKTLQCEYY
jgi:hypothetical protein